MRERNPARWAEAKAVILRAKPYWAALRRHNGGVTDPADCPYCRDWTREHPAEAPRASCGPCETCGRPGHVGAHPRRPTSHCLCPEHWQSLAAQGYHFELYHLVYVVVGLLAASALYRLLQDLLK